MSFGQAQPPHRVGDAHRGVDVVLGGGLVGQAGADHPVEPVALVGLAESWYLVGHCRLRDGIRSFRLDRVVGARLTDEPAPEHDIDPTVGIPDTMRRLRLSE